MNAWIAAAIILLTAGAAVGTDTPPTAWEYTCLQMELYEASCEALNPPAVIFSAIIHQNGRDIRGVYIHGEHQIFVSPDSPNARSTIIHEFAHYIFYENGMKERCKQEGIVRLIAGQEWDDMDKLLYKCPLN